ncbi:SANT/Myb_domain [Hexamita inflata]|uniref:SANT/Myb domain n=1 Tax=Hexamita inflata TaxID=28002 RepID=A0AA86TUP1_9EUKA|nr:SANT/Myb domain [Hexamita inflata]
MSQFELELVRLSLVIQISKIKAQIAQKIQSQSIQAVQKDPWAIKHQQEKRSQPKAIRTPSHHRTRWTAQEDSQLLQMVRKYGFDSVDQMEGLLTGRSKVQIYFRLRYLKTFYEENVESKQIEKMNPEWYQYFVENGM